MDTETLALFLAHFGRSRNTCMLTVLITAGTSGKDNMSSLASPDQSIGIRAPMGPLLTAPAGAPALPTQGDC